MQAQASLPTRVERNTRLRASGKDPTTAPRAEHHRVSYGSAIALNAREGPIRSKMLARRLALPPKLLALADEVLIE